MATPELDSRTTLIGQGPGRWDLMLALMDREHTPPVEFYLDDSDELGLTRVVRLWITSLTHSGPNGWLFTGLTTPVSTVASNREVSGYYNDHSRNGSFVEYLG